MDVWQLIALNASALLAVIGVLWKMHLTRTKDYIEEKAKRIAMHEKRELEFHQDMRALSSDVSRLEGERDGEKKGIEQIVKAVTEEIRYSRQEAYQLGKKSINKGE